MRDMIILTLTIVFWIALASITTALYNDPVIISELIEGNSSYVINVDTSQANMALNMSAEDNKIYLFKDYAPSQTKGFLNMIIRMLTFRIPSTASMPPLITTFISALNWILVLIMGLLVFRLIRHGGG